MLLDIFYLVLEKAWFTNFFEIKRWQAKHYSLARDNVKRGLVICLNNRFSLFSFSPLCLDIN